MKAFVFPGQGSQSTGMGKDIVEKFPEYNNYYDIASEAIQDDLYAIINSEDDTKLTLTQYTQPAILTTSIIAYEHIRKTTDLKPDVVAGHSLGEWTALATAGVLTFKDAVRLVHLRGKYMSEACPPGKGTMAAVIGLSDEEIEDCLNDFPNIVIANYNSPGQIVISGSTDKFDEAEKRLTQKGAKMVVRLNVSGPFHSPVIKDAKEKLEKEIEGTEFQTARIPVYQNADAKAHTSVEQIKKNLIKQVTSAVRWTQTVEQMISDGVDEFYEIGHGGVLSGLIKRINRKVKIQRFDKIIKK
ncbi:MAG: ACP S-malonyltransferase [Thermotogota bacterium]